MRDVGMTYAAENLKALRIAAGLSRRELVEALAKEDLYLHQTTLRRIEEGEQAMKASEALVIADYFEISVDQFLRDPADPLGAELVGLREKMTKAFRDLGFALIVFEVAYDELHERLEKDDVPPAVQSDAVRQAQSVEKLAAAYLPVVQGLRQNIEHPKAQEDSGDDQG